MTGLSFLSIADCQVTQPEVFQISFLFSMVLVKRSVSTSTAALMRARFSRFSSLETGMFTFMVPSCQPFVEKAGLVGSGGARPGPRVHSASALPAESARKRERARAAVFHFIEIPPFHEIKF